MTRRTPKIIAAVFVPLALLLSLLAWSVSSPPGSSPDEDYHLGSIWCAYGQSPGRCEPTATASTRELPGDVVQAAACFAFHPAQAATCPLDKHTMKPTNRGNWVDNGYPPVFYAVMGVFVSSELSTSVVVMRVLNVVLYVGLLGLLFFLLPPRMRPPLLWGALVTMVPLGAFLIASINPSSWAILQASGLWLAVWGFFEQTGKKKIGLAALSTVLMVVGAGARSDSAAYGVLAVAVAVVLGWRRDRRFLVELSLPALLVVIAAALFLTSGQSGIVVADSQSSAGGFTLLVGNLLALPTLWVGALGLWGLGWLDTAMPALVWVTIVTIVAGVTFWGLRRGTPRKWLALSGVGAGLVVVPLYILMREGILVGTGVQPRYIYPMMIMFVGVALVGFRSATLGMSRLQLAVVAAGLTIANTFALHTNMRRYITGVDDPGLNLDRGIEWWWHTPVSPMTIWIVGSLAFAAAICALAWVAWTRGPHRQLLSTDRVREAS
ncbi:DUF2142 domain-containing protein [Microbacterium panaciterrae]|uniref:DUF2142 domain-containing protein n=1 Tax=Microbacterium panaciterrae TaxID=985759 RepID=A0ABP8PFB4_9MICO